MIGRRCSGRHCSSLMPGQTEELVEELTHRGSMLCPRLARQTRHSSRVRPGGSCLRRWLMATSGEVGKKGLTALSGHGTDVLPLALPVELVGHVEAGQAILRGLELITHLDASRSASGAEHEGAGECGETHRGCASVAVRCGLGVGTGDVGCQLGTSGWRNRKGLIVKDARSKPRLHLERKKQSR